MLLSLLAGLLTSFQLDLVGSPAKRERELGGLFGADYRILGLCLWPAARTVFGALGCRVSPPTEVSADSRLHSVISSLSHSQGRGPRLCATGWDTSPIGSVTHYHRDQGWPHHQEWLCHRVWTDGTPRVPAWGCVHSTGHSCATREIRLSFLEP